MSSTAASIQRPIGGGESTKRPSIGRLVGVEVRKMCDTRAGFWLLATTALVTVLVAAGTLAFADTQDKALAGMLSLVILPSGFLLPVIGILLVSSEWSQRTTLLTFSLVPSRARVVVAKVFAGVAISIVATSLCLVVSLAASGAAGESMSLESEVVAQTYLFLSLAVLIGIAFGAAWLIPAAAIVSYFALPSIISILSSFSFFESVGGWVDQNTTLGRLIEGSLTGEEWAQAATSVGIWFVIPMAIGWWRITRSEIN